MTGTFKDRLEQLLAETGDDFHLLVRRGMNFSTAKAILLPDADPCLSTVRQVVMTLGLDKRTAYWLVTGEEP
jgi:hypothetical protein